MNLFSFRSVLAGLLCGALLLGACGDPGKKREPIGDVPSSASLDEDAIGKLLVKGARVYAGVREMESGEKSIVNGRPVARVSTKRASSMAALRTYLRAAFSDGAIDTVLTDYGVVEDGGKLWMIHTDTDDIRSYDDAEITSIESDGEDVVADVEVPLGDSGQTDEFQVRLTRVGGSWRLASDPFGGA
jgi:hypothetical protein